MSSMSVTAFLVQLCYFFGFTVRCRSPRVISALVFTLLAAKLFAQPNVGTQLWAYTVNYLISGSPAVGPDGTIYFANSSLFAVTNSGSNRWVFPLETGSGGDYNSSPAVAADGTVLSLIHISEPTR